MTLCDFKKYFAKNSQENMELRRRIAAIEADTEKIEKVTSCLILESQIAQTLLVICSSDCVRARYS